MRIVSGMRALCAVGALALVFGFGAPPSSSPRDASHETVTEIYCGGPLYSGGDTAIRDLKGSGFDTVVAWSVHVRPNGDLVLNDTDIVKSGVYVGDGRWPGRLRDLKKGGSVRTLLFSVGAWGTPDFAAIHALIDREGTGPDSALYHSFLTLKRTVPVDGIDLDDEDDLHHESIVRFTRMLQQMGYRVTFCPYREPDFWIGCAKDVTAAGGQIAAFNLQCYAGGARNDPAEWVHSIQAAGLKIPLYAGLWSLHGDSCGHGHDPVQMQEQFDRWRPAGIEGGFVWVYDDVLRCGPSTAAYARAIKDGSAASAKNISVEPVLLPGKHVF